MRKHGFIPFIVTNLLHVNLMKEVSAFSDWQKMEEPRVLYRIFRQTLNIQQSQNNLAGVKTGGFRLTLV